MVQVGVKNIRRSAALNDNPTFLKVSELCAYRPLPNTHTPTKTPPPPLSFYIISFLINFRIVIAYNNYMYMYTTHTHTPRSSPSRLLTILTPPFDHVYSFVVFTDRSDRLLFCQVSSSPTTPLLHTHTHRHWLMWCMTISRATRRAVASYHYDVPCV